MHEKEYGTVIDGSVGNNNVAWMFTYKHKE
jgi:hypothetical protein